VRGRAAAQLINNDQAARRGGRQDRACLAQLLRARGKRRAGLRRAPPRLLGSLCGDGPRRGLPVARVDRNASMLPSAQVLCRRQLFRWLDMRTAVHRAEQEHAFLLKRSARSPAPALASSRQPVTADVMGRLVGGSAPPERWSGPWRGCQRRPCACAPHRTRPCAPTLPARRSPPGAVKCGSCRPERRAGLTQYQHSADTLFTNTYPPHMKACVVELPMQRTATRWAASATPSTALCRHALHAPSARPGRAPAP